MPEICAIILAAGKSERMGRNKLLLPFQGKPMILAVIDRVKHSGIERICIVLGAFRDDMLAAITGLPVSHCYNAIYEQGMFTSVQCGFRNLPASADAAIVFLGDQPMIPAEVTREIIRVYRQCDKGILIPKYRGKRGHPVLIDKKYKGIISTFVAEAGLHMLLDKYRDDIMEVEVQAPDILRDIDTEQDYKNEIKLN